MSPAARDSGSLHVDLDGVRLELAAVSDRGTVRRENQDRWAMRPVADGCVLVLGDGMGGHADGAVAAHLAVQAAAGHAGAAAQPADALRGAVAAAVAAVATHRRAHGGVMCGTTLVIAIVTGDRVRLANIGDSRAYRVRDGVAEQLTHDHSWTAEQVREGHLDAGRAARHPARSMLTRALTGEPVHADIFSTELRGGDVLLLCSDGVWDAVDDALLASQTGPQMPLSEAVASLCDRALTAGSTDNVTVVGCRVDVTDD